MGVCVSCALKELLRCVVAVRDSPLHSSRELYLLTRCNSSLLIKPQNKSKPAKAFDNCSASELQSRSICSAQGDRSRPSPISVRCVW